jgi:hypothetical protein
VLNCKPDMKEGGDKMEDKQKIEKREREQNEGIIIYTMLCTSLFQRECCL